jgi:hypothetical protein
MRDSTKEAWRTYPYYSGDLIFPDDEGAHPDTPDGWWYVNLHLDDETGNRIILFTSFVTTANEQLGSVADLSRGKHLDQYLRGEVTAKTGHLDVQFRNGNSPPSYLRQVANEPFHYDFYYKIESYEFELQFESKKPPYALAETGRVQQLPGIYSYYYVLPRLAVRGIMRQGGRDATAVTGIGWLDRQWYPATNPGAGSYRGHFWIAIHLNDGTDISTYRCLWEDGSCPYPLFDVMGPDNSYTHYVSDTIKSLKLFQTSPIGQGPIQEFQFPLSAKVVHLPTGTDLTLTIAAPDPMDNVLDLGPKGCVFEGGFTVNGSHNGHPVRGDAFVEVFLFGAHEGP